MSENAEDEQLLARARSGDRRSLDELLDRLQQRVYRFGLKLCGDPEDARDVLQNTLLAMAQGIGDFRGASSLSTWLYTIARNFCTKQRRTSKFAPAMRSLETEATTEAARVADAARTPDEQLAGKQLEAALGHAIASLEPMYREVLVLRDIEGLTAPEVGEILGITPQAVKSRLHRARLGVRERLAPLLEAPVEAPAAEGCPDVLSLYSQYLEGDISAETCEQMERHLERCERCRGACESLQRTLALCRTTGDAVEVPAAVQQQVKAALRELLAERG